MSDLSGQARSVPAETHPCGCSVDHQPNPRITQLHHVVPLSWGGPDEPENEVPLCGTAHDAVHWLLREYQRHDGRPPWSVRRKVGRWIRALAERGWQERPPPPTITVTNNRIGRT